MADDDDQGTSSGSRPKLLLPKAPGPAQPLSHVASRHRKKLDAALSSAGYYDVAHGRESARAQRIQVIDLYRRSTTGFCIFLANAVIAHKCQRQGCIAMSTTEIYTRCIVGSVRCV